jgi:hypothetical protein
LFWSVGRRGSKMIRFAFFCRNTRLGLFDISLRSPT